MSRIPLPDVACTAHNFLQWEHGFKAPPNFTQVEKLPRYKIKEAEGEVGEGRLPQTCSHLTELMFTDTMEPNEAATSFNVLDFQTFDSFMVNQPLA